MVFESDDSTVELGVGKNMVHSIKFWLRATKIAELTENGMSSTAIGDDIFSKNGWDPYLEDEGTIWLIHWNLCTNPSVATSWFWFFNYFHKTSFPTQEALQALKGFLEDQEVKKPSQTTVAGDIAVLLRMYSQGRVRGRTALEDAIDSPLSLLGLISYSPVARLYDSVPSARKSLPVNILGFAVNELLDFLSIDSIPIRDLIYGQQNSPALGAIFRLSEAGILAKLELLIATHKNTFEIRETAGIHQLYRLGEIESMSFLKDYYKLRHGNKNYA